MFPSFHRFVPALAIAAAVFVAAPSFAQNAPARAMAPIVFGAGGVYTLVGESANGQTVGMPSGNPDVITLKEQMGTGYSWSLKSIQSHGGVMTLQKVVHEANAGKPGGFDSANFTFATSGKGTVDLEFVYARPWDPSTAKTLTITIDLQP
ncbi:MAG TPA: protease inhibitor I42 family protein [Candidatus Obscuribacterales bacterium]